jgi:hypothetical protein
MLMLHEVGSSRARPIRTKGLEATVMFHHEGHPHPLSDFGRYDASGGASTAPLLRCRSANDRDHSKEELECSRL